GAAHQNILILDVSMNVALSVCVGKGIENLRDDLQRFPFRQATATRVSQSRSVGSIDEFSYQVDDAVVHPSILELHNAGMFERRRHIDLAHEAAHCFVAYGKLRKQGLDGDRGSSGLMPPQHHASHAAAAEHSNHVVARNWLGSL